MEVGWVGIAGCLEVRGFGEARRLRGSRGCLFLRGNISKARRKSCQINFSPFQSHPWEFLPHFTSADLTTPLFWMELLLSLSFSFRWGRLFTVVTPHTPSSPCTFQPFILEYVHENKTKVISNTPLKTALSLCWCYCCILLRLFSSGAQSLYLMIEM